MPPGSTIVNTASINAYDPGEDIIDYAATKAAVVGYSKGWARDLGPKGITVNVVQPGPINTDMNPDSGDFAAIQKSMTALGRYGTAEELAAVVAFLVSPRASWISGASVTVDGCQSRSQI